MNIHWGGGGCGGDSKTIAEDGSIYDGLGACSRRKLILFLLEIVQPSVSCIKKRDARS